MPELLLEIRSEEIPARMQARAAEDLKRLVAERLAADGLAAGEGLAWATPRRLGLAVDGIPEAQPDTVEERRGPRTDAPQAAIDGFLKSTGATLAECERRSLPKGEFWFATVRRQGRPTAALLAEALPAILAAFPWPKSMRWATHGVRWVRPLTGILCLFGGRVVPFAFGPETATDRTVGHRFLKPEPFAVRDFAEYRHRMPGAKVMFEAPARRAWIEAEAAKRATAEGLTLKPDQGLLDEVAGLVEWPVVLGGRIEPAFMDLPAEVLVTAMRTHQRYFALTGETGRLASRFVVVAATEASDGGRAIAAGNERVLKARLADAAFFWNQDRARPLESRVPGLGKLVFHARLGSMADKTTRLQALIADLAWHIPGVDAALGERAALLAKADLATGMVGEFPELQGIMGRHYALHEGARREVAEAIGEHYAPAGPNDRCPTAPLSIALALADKIDTLAGFFAISETPTGSKDPYALRRAALGIIRLVVENRLRLPLAKLFRAAHALHASRPGADSAFAAGADAPTAALLEFFADRLKVHLRDRGVRHDLVAAVFAAGGEDDLVRLIARVEALSAFLASEDGANLLTAYRRARNIVAIEEKKDRRDYAGAVAAALLAEREEQALHAVLEAAVPRIAEAIRQERFGDAMAALAGLRRPVDAFFDRVTVNCDDADRRANRLRMLARIRSALDGVADFARVETAGAAAKGAAAHAATN